VQRKSIFFRVNLFAVLIYHQTGGKPAGSCTAALFLKAFVDGLDAGEGKEPPLKWAHIDIAGTMEVCFYLICLEFFILKLVLLSGYEGNALLGEGFDGSSDSVS
jgi:hypothetical protein